VIHGRTTECTYLNASKARRPGPGHHSAVGQRHAEQTLRRQQPHLVGQEA